MRRVTSVLFKCHIMFAVIFSCFSVAYEYSGVQKDFLSAEKKIWKSASKKYQSLYNKLHFYPLQPYLDQQRLIHQMDLSLAKDIDQFLTKYEGTPLDWPLRKKWLQYLKKRKRQILFTNYFKSTTNAELTCYQYLSQLKSGISEEVILPKVTALWVVGKSQSTECDPLFAKWEKAGYRTNDIIWQRLKLAADGGKHTLIPYLTMLLPKEQQYLGRLWHKVRRDPSYVARLNKFTHKSVQEAEILTYGLKRFIWHDQNRAIKTFKTVNTLFPFNEEQLQEITQKFALALASKKHKEAPHWLHQVEEKFINSNIIQWRIADVLRTQNWQTIKNELTSLPISKQVNLQWKYWFARSQIETGQVIEGKELMFSLSTQRHYYGFLAASFLGLPFNLQDKPLSATSQEKQVLLNYPAAKRAFEFFHLGRYNQARLEWNYWLSQLDDRGKLVAAKIANEKKWYDRAIFTLSKVGYLHDVDLRFPMAFEREIKSYAKHQEISSAWAFAIARRESSFMSDANSPVGARGLMQVMPKTAKQLAHKNILKRKLFDAEQNVFLGTKYLRQLLDKHKGNFVLATAAYNAGPYRVKSWLKNSNSLPADIWIETIPFKETRDYVKSVLAYRQIYHYKIEQSSSLFDELIAMKIPH